MLSPHMRNSPLPVIGRFNLAVTQTLQLKRGRDRFHLLLFRHPMVGMAASVSNNDEKMKEAESGYLVAPQSTDPSDPLQNFSHYIYWNLSFVM